MPRFFGGRSGSGGSASVTVNGKTGSNITLNKDDIGLGQIPNMPPADWPVNDATAQEIATLESDITAELMLCLKTASLGANDGVAQLDATGKLKAAQIPDSIVAGLKWQGTWNASTNTPTIPVAASGNNGHFYRVSTAGNQSVTGSATDFGIGDWLISNGSAWQRVANTLADATTTTKGQVQLASDLAGTAASPLVAKINGIAVPSSAPTAARKFMLSSSTSQLAYDGIVSADLLPQRQPRRGLSERLVTLAARQTARPS
jgi:hypothetical protein